MRDPDGSTTDAASRGETADDLYDEAPCGYLSTLPDGTIVKVNRTFLDWTGYERADLLGKRFQDLLTPGGRIYHETHYSPLLRMQGSVREIALEIVDARGARIPALLNSRVKLDGGGAPAVIRTIVVDATERRSYERELLAERKRAQESEARARLLAETLQSSLVPPTPSQIRGFDVAASYRPAGAGDIVGGDFFDVFETRRGDSVVVMGDVEGKGVEAARVTAAARYTLRALAMASTEPSAVLRALNDALLDQGTDRFCTVVYALVSNDADRFAITICSAGHPFPIKVARGEVPAPIGKGGTMLGIFDEPTLDDVELTLVPGEAMVFYTDGVTEARAPDGTFYGEDRLYASLEQQADTSAADLAEQIVSDALLFQGGVARDDIAVLVLRAVP